jgi:hypothetical protein
MPFLPDCSSPASRRVILGLCVVVAAFALLTFWQVEDAWYTAGLFLLTLILGFAVFVLIWLAALQTHRLSRALRDSLGLVTLVVLAAMAGRGLSQAELRPAQERAETLVAAIAEHQRVHGVLPESLSAIEAALPPPMNKLHKITYQPKLDGTFTLFFQPSWYRHEYSSLARSWKVYD